MPYTTVTVDQFKTAKPQFDTVNASIVSDYLNLSGIVVDESWLESQYQPAIIAYTCHLMTISGLGDDATSELFRDGMAEYQTVRSSELTLVKFSKVADKTPYEEWLNSTPCGKMFGFMLMQSKAGPRILTGGYGCASGYAKDHQGPAYGWPGVFLQ